MTDTQPTARPAVPTDPHTLGAMLAAQDAGPVDVALPTGRDELVALLTDQLTAGGNEPRAQRYAADLVDSALRYAAHDREIRGLRGELAAALGAARAAAEAARVILDLLCSAQVYDVEYAEGGADVTDLRVFLLDAGRALRAAERLNPCKTPKDGADQ